VEEVAVVEEIPEVVELFPDVVEKVVLDVDAFAESTMCHFITEMVSVTFSEIIFFPRKVSPEGEVTKL